MERPSHSIIALSAAPGSRRIMGMGLSFAVQGLAAAILIGGLVVRVGLPPQPFVFTPDQVRAKPTLPPPAVKMVRADPPVAVAPDITIAPPPSSGGGGVTAEPQPDPVAPTTPRQPQAQPPAVPDRAAAAIAGTHTVPPYPALAQRLGVEGKVMLRLTVQPDGRVAQADVITSSGRRDLDQAAQAWIVGHWTYSPAIKGGVPAASQVMAAVEFTLTNAR